MFKILALVIQINLAFGWKYQTKCTRHLSAFNHNIDTEYNSIIEDFERDLFYENEQNQNINKLRLKCPNVNDFLFIGQTKYGVSLAKPAVGDDCRPSPNDCVVTVDYIANQCNGLNSCDIVLDAQFLHSCKNNSDYISIAYECIPGSQKIDICSNDETFIIDSSFAKNKNSNSLSRFGSFYLTSPDYPIEYKNNMNNCSCKMEYVKIDSNSESSISTKSEMNLVFRSYEFDLEESITDVCQKDYFRIKSDKKDVSMCGQNKRFKELYSSGAKFSLEFKSDDVITRRGFLIKVSTQSETYCPFNSKRFSSNKCIKLFGDDDEKNSYKLDWFEASKSCESLNGRLISIKDFVDDMRIDHFLVDRVKYWSRKQNESKCFTKALNDWSEESCMQKNAFICEFEPVLTKQREKLISGLSDNSGNRLIRVACGSSSTIFSSSFRSESSTRKSVNSNSILNTQRPSTHSSRSTSKSSTTKILKSIITIEDNEDVTSTFKIALKNDNNIALLSQDFILIIAIACGVSIVLIAINIFCLWSYLSKKLRKYYENKNDIDQQTYRSSTMSRSNKSTNRTLTSSVDSYAKVPPFDLEHMSACESLSSSGSELAYNTNKPTQHYYETLNKQNNQWNNYAEYNPINHMPSFDSMVVMPCGTINSHYMTTIRPVPINPTVVLLKQLPQHHQQQVKLNEQEQYSCVVYGELSPASSNASSNQPLITFSSSSSGVSAI